MATIVSIEKDIDQKIGEVRTESLDLSFGEIVNLRKNKEFIIQPEYQRLFRWSDEQKSRLIESILLELPIPQIFVMEKDNGVYELIDGLQRISTFIQFVEPEVIGGKGFVLQGCDIIKGLNGLSYKDMPMSLKLRLKRSSLRTIVIKRQSESFLRYEMFKRLNTGGSLLSPQEIRNCSARMVGDSGGAFYSFLTDLASDANFKKTIQTLAQEEIDKKGDEELVLRFFAAKNASDKFKGNVRDWLDKYMESILLKQVKFDAKLESGLFTSLFSELAVKLGETAFVKFRKNDPIGGLAPAYFEAISIGGLRALDILKDKSASKVQKAIIDLVQSANFRTVTGPGANTKAKLEMRISLAQRAIEKA